MRETETMRWSSISFASLRASSTGWTWVRNARPKTPSNSASILPSMLLSTLTAAFCPARTLVRGRAPRRRLEAAQQALARGSEQLGEGHVGFAQVPRRCERDARQAGGADGRDNGHPDARGE